MESGVAGPVVGLVESRWVVVVTWVADVIVTAVVVVAAV